MQLKWLELEELIEDWLYKQDLDGKVVIDKARLSIKIKLSHQLGTNRSCMRVKVLGPKDWKAIFALPFEEKDRKVFSLLKSRNNGGIDWDDDELFSEHYAGVHTFAAKVNAIFRAHGSKYRFTHRKSGPYKIYIKEIK
jgi:hypothetical protein